MNSIWIAQRVMREIWRDPRTVVFFFLVPLAVMGLVYLALAKDEMARVAVVYRGSAQMLADPVEAALARAAGIRRVALPDLESPPGQRFFATTPQEPDLERKILAALRTGRADAVLLLPAALIQERSLGRPGVVTVYVEGSRPQLTALVRQAVLAAAAQMAPALASEQGPYARGLALPESAAPSCPAGCAGAALPELRIAYLHGAAAFRLVDYFLPTLLPFFIFFFTFMVSTITFQRERSRGTLERIVIAPVHLIEVVLGYILGFSAFCLVQVGIVIVAILALVTFPVTVAQVASLVFIGVLLMLIALAIGLLVSFNARSEFQAVQFVPLVILPQIFLSDLIWTLDGFPKPFQWFAQLLPLTHANAITRDLLLKQQALWESWPRLLALGGMLAAAFLVLAWEGRRKGAASPEE